eukprot:2263588-Rhodomonas_salina.1
MKQRWVCHQQHASHGHLTIGKIFDLVEAGLKSRLWVAGGAAAVAEQTLDEQIREVIGPTQHDPNQALRMRESPGLGGQKHALGGLASLTLGPALKLQADRSVASMEDRAQVNTPSKHLRAPDAPVGRKRPRKGVPRRSPFDDDLWNDDPFNADLLSCTPSEEDCFEEAADRSASPPNCLGADSELCSNVSYLRVPRTSRESGADDNEAGIDGTRSGLCPTEYDSKRDLGEGEGMTTCDNACTEPESDSLQYSVDDKGMTTRDSSW